MSKLKEKPEKRKKGKEKKRRYQRKYGVHGRCQSSLCMTDQLG